MRPILLATAVLACMTGISQNNPVGIFAHHADIGNPGIKGNATYHTADQRYQLSAGGYNIWFNRDEFHYACNKIKGDFILTADIAFTGEGKDPHRKTGWMVRAGEQEDAAHITAAVHGDGLTVLQWRPLRGAYMRDPQDEIFSPKKNVSSMRCAGARTPAIRLWIR